MSQRALPRAYVVPMTNTEKRVIPPDRVMALLNAIEKLQCKFDSDPDLKELYHKPFKHMLDMAEKNIVPSR